MGEVMIEGGATKVMEREAAVVTAGMSKVFAIISTMQLIVKLRVLAIMTGFILLVLFLDGCLELGGCIPLVNFASYLHFQSWLLLALLLVATEPIEMSHC